MACSGTPQLDDHRGFLQAGNHNEASSELQWTPTTSKRIRNGITSIGRRSSVEPLSLSVHDFVPLCEITPEELDLEKTLVEQTPRQSVRTSNTPRQSALRGSTLISSSSCDQLSSSGFRDRTFTAGQSPQRSSTISTLRRSTFFQKLSFVMSKGKGTPERGGAPERGPNSLECTADLQAITSAKLLRVALEREGVDQDVDGLIHIIVRKKYKSENKRQKLLIALLTYSSVDVNARAPNGMTALHRAAEDCDIECVKILVCFGAKVNIIDNSNRTPLDLLKADMADMESALCIPFTQGGMELPRHKPTAVRRGSRTGMIKFLNSIGAVSGELSVSVSAPPQVEPFPLVPIVSNAGSGSTKDLSEAMDWALQLTARYSELERNIRQRFHSASYTPNKVSFQSDEAISLSAQLHEMAMFQKAGSRILFLDGGGIRGLVQIEILCQLEQKTGRKIVELFDWIVGTSTGGIIALGLVYAKKSVTEMRQLYFRMKDEIFGKVRGGTFNTAGLEALLKQEFSEHVCMDDITYPRVLISAVQKEHINLKLHFFNNCFQDEYCKHWPVWKVARFTSAAPVLFGECNEYVDGGVLANNPSESGLSKIQDFHRRRGEKLPVSLVVSVGSGKYPIKKLGSVDFLFAGSSGFNLTGLKDGTANLMSLLSYALVETSVSADNCKSRCEEQDILYFRLNPRLEEVVASGETNMKTLLSMILQARRETNEATDFSNLVLRFHELSEKCRKMHSQINGVQ